MDKLIEASVGRVVISLNKEDGLYKIKIGKIIISLSKHL